VAASACDAPGSLSAVTVSVFEILAALALQWAFWSHVKLHPNPQAAEFAGLSYVRYSIALRHGKNEVGPVRDGRIAIALLTGHECSENRAPP